MEWQTTSARTAMLKGMPHPEIVIHVDGQMHKVASPSLSGAQIKALAGKDLSYQLFLEQKGGAADQQIPDQQAVLLENGMHFYTMPPATFGR